jgi:hypothetical protein
VYIYFGKNSVLKYCNECREIQKINGLLEKVASDHHTATHGYKIGRLEAYVIALPNPVLLKKVREGKRS